MSGLAVMRRARIVVFALLGACGGVGSGAQKSGRGGPPATETVSAAARGEAGSTTAVHAPAGAPGEPRVVLAGEVREGGGVDLVLQNHDNSPLRVAADVAVERVGSVVSEPLASTALSLRFSCEVPPAACLDLVPGAELRPPPWLATASRAQCNERGAARAPPGRYRFVARTCDGARIEGTPFDFR